MRRRPLAPRLTRECLDFALFAVLATLRIVELEDVFEVAHLAVGVRRLRREERVE